MSAGTPGAVGVDLGTTYTCAAVADPGGTARVVQLTGTSQTIPSVVSITDQGVIAGEAAERRLISNPTDTAREFKRRLGDATPIVLAGEGYGAEVLTGHLLSEVLERVEQNEGGRPSVVGLAHPAAWGPFRLDLLRDAARHAGVDDAVLVPEPVAAAVANRGRVEPGSLVAVYDLGGGTFDAAVVRVGDGDSDVEVVGTPEGVERLGGIDFDQAVMAHVDNVLDGQVFGADRSDPDTRQALMRLRAECQAAKEHLSQDSDVDIAVALPGVTTSVRMTRAEFETAVQPRLADSLAVFDRVVASAGSGWDDIASILLVGGSSNVPLVAQLVGEHTGRPVVTATSPHLAIATGTAMVAASSVNSTAPVIAAPVAADAASTAATSGDTGAPVDPPSKSKLPLLVAGVVGLLAVVAAIVLLGGGGGDDTDDQALVETTVDGDTDEPPTTEPESTEPDATEPDTTEPDGEEGSPAPAAISVDSCTTVADDTLAVVATDAGAVVVGPTESRLVEGLGPADCGIDPAGGAVIELAAPGTPTHATSFGQLFAISTDRSGAIGNADDNRECDLISGSAAMTGGGVVFPIDDTGAVGRIRTQGGACEAGDAAVFEGLSATAIGVSSSDQIAVGGTTDAGVTVRVLNGADSGVDLTADDFDGALVSVDAIVRCGERWCVIDLSGESIHVIDASNAAAGSAPIAGTPLADATAIISATPSTDGPGLVAARLSDGSIAVVTLA